MPTVAWLVAALALIAVATLTPQHGQATVDWHCVLCGRDGGADAFDNVLLFIPLGAALRRRGIGLWRALAIGCVVSVGVELAQAAGIAGRSATASDVVTNTIGAAVGSLVALAATMLRRQGSASPTVVSTMGGALWACLTAASGWLMTREDRAPAVAMAVGDLPSVPDRGWYHGRIDAARIDGQALVPPGGTGPVIVATPIGRTFAADVAVRGGDRRGSLVPIVFVHAADGDERLMIATRGDDAILRLRLRAARWRLRAPSVTIPHALASIADDTTRPAQLHAEVDGATLRLTVLIGGSPEPSTGVRTLASRAAARAGPAAVWSVLVPFVPLNGPAAATATALWLGVPATLLAFCASLAAGRRGRDAAIGAWVAVGTASVAVLAIVPVAMGFGAEPPAHWLAVVAGIGAGTAAGRRWRRRSHLARPRPSADAVADVVDGRAVALLSPPDGAETFPPCLP